MISHSAPALNLEKIKQQNHRASESLSSNTPQSAASSARKKKHLKEGLLWQKSGQHALGGVWSNPWKLRWFTFDKGVIQCYKQQGISGSFFPKKKNVDGRILKSTFLMETPTVELEKDPKKEFVFKVSGCQSAVDNSPAILTLAAATEEDMIAWMTVLEVGKVLETTVMRRHTLGMPVVEMKKAVSRRAPAIKDFYDVRERLGAGGFSIVKKGIDLTDGQVYALKMISANVFQQNQQQIDEEVKFLASLNHPNIVKLKEVVRTPQFFVIVMEFLQGGELFDRIVKRKRYNENDAKATAVKILDAVRYLHENDIVHRDLKPENILFVDQDENAEIKVTDFGFATMYEKSAKLRASCGTPEYIAPEILEEKEYGSAVDLWSFGVMMYTLLCGFPPFHADNETKLFFNICRGKFDFPSPYWDLVSPQAKDLIRHLLELNPEKRYTAQQALEHEWFNDVVGDAISRPSADLSGALRELRIWNAFRKFKKSVLAVIAANKVKDVLDSLTARSSSESSLA
eukprot:c20242_g3_i1.p1 GENE.c20242_g3_i1~~c20242_g3_i1.p1  ORF type:complete len:514 (-),score=208.12 c20242_g3_i1:20-1561(-)